jgi:hypothetical protein
MAKVRGMYRPRVRVLTMYNECDQITVGVLIQFPVYMMSSSIYIYIMNREESSACK